MIGYGKTVLLVDERKTDRQRLATALEQDGFILVQAEDVGQAVCKMQLRHFDVVLTGDHMPVLDGLDLLRQCRMAKPETPVIVYASPSWGRFVVAKAQGAFAWIFKSSDSGSLLNMLHLAVLQRAERETSSGQPPN